MLTARRMHERAVAEANGAPPQPSRPRRTEVTIHEHEAALLALEARLRVELTAEHPSAVVELKLDEEPFKSAVADLVAEFERRVVEVVAHVELLEAWKARVLPAEHKRPTLEEFVASGYQADAYEAHMLEWEAELVGADAIKVQLLEAEVLDLKRLLPEAGAAKPVDAVETTEAAAPLAATLVATGPVEAKTTDESPQPEAAKPKGGKPKGR